MEDYHRLLDRDDIEMVIIALPLHLHAPVAIEAMEKGKHVLCEKLMAKTVGDCKRMARAAHKTGRMLAIGHQRHYSYLYANALEVAGQKDILGDVRHIRAFWHRNQTEGGRPGRGEGRLRHLVRESPGGGPRRRYRKYGYQSLEELVRWRLSKRTGEGLMAELGSHQLDACGILLGMRPKAVSGVAVNSFFTDGREVEDHVYLTYEYPRDVVVTYSSITTNEADSYGEQVMGTRGTLAILVGARSVLAEGKGAEGHADLLGGAADRAAFGGLDGDDAMDRGGGLAGHAVESRLSRGAGAYGVADSQSGQRQAAVRARGRAGGCGGDAGIEHGRARAAADRVSGCLVRREFQRDTSCDGSPSGGHSTGCADTGKGHGDGQSRADALLPSRSDTRPRGPISLPGAPARHDVRFARRASSTPRRTMPGRNVEQRHAFLLVGVGAGDDSDARLGVARVVGQVRRVGGDVKEVARAHPDVLAQALAVPHPGFAGDDIDGAFVIFMQMRFGAAAGRDRDAVQA